MCTLERKKFHHRRQKMGINVIGQEERNIFQPGSGNEDMSLNRSFYSQHYMSFDIILEEVEEYSRGILS